MSLQTHLEKKKNNNQLTKKNNKNKTQTNNITIIRDLNSFNCIEILCFYFILLFLVVLLLLLYFFCFIYFYCFIFFGRNEQVYMPQVNDYKICVPNLISTYFGDVCSSSILMKLCIKPVKLNLIKNRSVYRPCISTGRT